MKQVEAIVRLGDLHDERATELIKKDDTIWIKKYRNASTELAFKTFLFLLEEEGFIYSPGSVDVIESGEEEHTEVYVEHKAVQSEDEVHLYFKRCGALAFLTYLFTSTDLHNENIIAHGGFPTIVDYETLLSGEIARTYKSQKGTLADTVLKSGLFSCWTRESEKDIDYGGLTSCDDLNSKNLIFLNNTPQKIYDYTSDLLEGFAYTYEFISKRKPLFRQAVHVFDNCEFRVILRPTQLYQNIIEFVSGNINYNKKELATSLLERAYKNDIDKGRLEKVKATLEAEVSSVLKGEAPLFWVKGNGCDLFSREGILQEGFLQKSPVDKALSRLEDLSEKDMLAQIKVLSSAISYITPEKTPDKQYPINAFSNMDITLEIMKLLEEHYIEILLSHWMRLGRSASSRLFIQSVGFGLYDGVLGILCFYAAHYYNKHNEDILQLIEKSYHEYKSFAKIQTISINAAIASLQDGIGGHILALLHLSELTGMEEFRKDAEKILYMIKTNDELPEGECDVLGGYSGLALSLSKINSPCVEDIAKLLLPKLMAYEPTLTGMAHGAAGVALALGNIKAVLTQSKNHVDLALLKSIDRKIIDVLVWENSYYDDIANNWRDLRSSSKRAFMFGWCSGAPGIGMARKALKEISSNEEIVRICDNDIDLVKRALKETELLKKDGLCCGNSARLMAASFLGFDLGDIPERFKQKISRKGVALVHIANTSDFIPGLMQGYAGIGYALEMYGNQLCGSMLS